MSSLQSRHGPIPNFYNYRRQAAIDHLLKIGLNPFDAVSIAPENRPSGGTAAMEDRYLREMRSMPRLNVETAWEIATMKEHVADLASRIQVARKIL